MNCFKDSILKKSQGETEIKKLGIFGGVFTPDVLTILGVIMYLRLGWVVGNAGFAGAVLIILLAKTVTISTALSMSSITTNINIGSGGAYSIIAKSLGLEAGGSVGIPFYISQTLSTALYIVGFTTGWESIFPHHDPLIVSIIVLLLLITIAFISANFAIKIQYIIMFIIALSLISIFATPLEPKTEITIVGEFEKADFWHVFAIFFPAVTGIMAGANLSGDLKEPRKAIPYGTLSAIGITLIIYILMAFFSAKFLPESKLLNDELVFVKNSRIGLLVTFGLLAATFSSALGSLVGAPRILQALSEHRTVPFSNIFVVKRKNGEPMNAAIFTSVIVLFALFIGSLNMLASLITMFFLITYGMINIVVFVQQSMKIISFRPTFKIPRFVSLFGALSCLFIMFLINSVFSIFALITIIAIYFWLARRGLKAEWGDIRGGVFLVLAEKASRLASKFPRHQVSWKPDLLVPVEDPKVWSGSLLFIRNISYPSGSIFAFTVKDENVKESENELADLLAPLKEQSLLVNSTIIEDTDFLHGSKLVIQTLKAGALRPNTLFLTLGDTDTKDEIIKQLSSHALKHDMGLMILKHHKRTSFGMQKNINLWLRDKSPNWHLAMLIALQLQSNWEGKLNIIAASNNPNDKKNIRKFFNKLSDQARLPSMTEFHILVGNFKDVLSSAPQADINILGLAGAIPFDFIRTAPELTKTSCLFVKDSGKENALV